MLTNMEIKKTTEIMNFSEIKSQNSMKKTSIRPSAKHIKAILVEFAYLIVTSFGHIFKETTLQTNSMKSDDIPVLLVHGYMNNHFSWLNMEKALKNRGYKGNIYTIKLKGPLNSIESFAKQLADRIGEIVEKTGSEKVHLIGHSMGGLICYYYKNILDKENIVSKIITIGSPLKGINRAKISIGICGKQMLPHSSLLARLNFNGDIPQYHFASSSDQVVYPIFTSLINKPNHKNFLIKDVGHLSMLFNNEVSDTIYQCLAE